MTNRFRKHSLANLVVALILMFAPILANSQELSEQKQTVVFLFGSVTMEDANHKPVVVETALGTGFLVIYPDARLSNSDGFGYLITAKHVLKDGNGKFFPEVKVRMNLQKPLADGRGYAFIEHVPVADRDGNLLWYHADVDEDVAAIPFVPDQSKFAFKALPISMFATDDSLKQDKVQEGDNLYFIGLMGAYYGYNRNYPVVRRGTLAMMTPETIKTATGPQKVSIAELSSWPGNSGSPVFLNISGARNGSLMLGQKISLYGILLGGFINGTPLTVVDHPEAQLFAGDHTSVGVSYMLPAASIRNALDNSAVKKIRDAEVARLLAASRPSN